MKMSWSRALWLLSTNLLPVTAHLGMSLFQQSGTNDYCACKMPPKLAGQVYHREGPAYFTVVLAKGARISLHESNTGAPSSS